MSGLILIGFGFIGFVDDYGNGSLIALFDFKNESLFQKVWEI